MKQKNRTYKNKKGGFLKNRLNSLLKRKTVKTYCCNSKTSSNNILKSGSNVGKSCKRSYTGQCLPGNNYKFRCFDSKFDDSKEILKIDEKDDNTCEYISGAVSKVGKTVAAATVGTGKLVSETLKTAFPLFLAGLASPSGGGKKRKSRSTRKSKKNKKHHRK